MRGVLTFQSDKKYTLTYYSLILGRLLHITMFSVLSPGSHHRVCQLLEWVMNFPYLRLQRSCLLITIIWSIFSIKNLKRKLTGISFYLFNKNNVFIESFIMLEYFLTWVECDAGSNVFSAILSKNFQYWKENKIMLNIEIAPI